MFHLKRLFKALQYSLQGFCTTLKAEAAFQLEVFLSFLIVPLGWYCGKTYLEQVLLISSWILVLLVEILNSAIETTVDRIGLEKNLLSKKAKDAGSCAVLLALLLFGFVWVRILLG